MQIKIQKPQELKYDASFNDKGKFLKLIFRHKIRNNKILENLKDTTEIFLRM